MSTTAITISIACAHIAAHEQSGTTPRIFFQTDRTGEELFADNSFVRQVDRALAASGYKRDENKGGFAPGGITGVRASDDENTPRQVGEGCIFLMKCG